MSHPLCFSIHEIREWLAAGPPYPLDPSRDLVYHLLVMWIQGILRRHGSSGTA